MNRRTLTVLALLALATVCTPLAAATRTANDGVIAFSRHVHGISQVFTVRPDGTGLRQVTHAAADAGANGLSWSPDARDLLYTVSYPSGKDAILKSHADGSGARSISPPCTGTCLGDDDPVYSPDGKKIAFVRAFGPIVNDNASVAAVFTMNTDGSQLTQLTQTNTPTSTEDHQPQWSPDGTKIAFTRINTTAAPRNKSAIEVMNADGSNLRRLTPFRIEAQDPHWSPNGKRLLFNTYATPIPGRSANLYTMHADGTHRLALTHYAGGTLQAFADGWSPGGRQIVFQRMAFSGTDTEVGGFFILDVRSKHIRRLTPVRIRYDARAAWGKNAQPQKTRSINQAKTHRVNGDIVFGGFGPNLLATNPDGSGAATIASCPVRCSIFAPAWSPDGSRIAFIRGQFAVNYPSRMSLYVAAANGGGAKRLASCGDCGGPGSDAAAWSPGGRRIAFSRDAGAWGQYLWVVAPAGGKPHRLTRCRRVWCADDHPVWSPDGRLLIFERTTASDGTFPNPAHPGRETRLYTVRPDGSDLTRVANGTDPQWSPDGRKIAFEDARGIEVANADGSDRRLLFSQTGGSGPGVPSWSPDGKKLLFFNTPGSPNAFVAEVWTMNADGTHTKRLYRSGCCVGDWAPPIWSPDGREIAFSADSARGTYVINGDGTGLRRVSTTIALSLSWQPLHTQPQKMHSANGPLTLIRWKGTDPVLDNSIVTVAQDGQLKLLLRPKACCELQSVDWAPSGRRLAFALGCVGCGPAAKPGIYVADPDGSQRRIRAGFDSDLDWSPDGSRLAYVASSGAQGSSIYVVKHNGSDPRLIDSPTAGTDSSPSWSPNGTRLVFSTKQGGRSSVSVIHLNGSRRVVLLRDGASAPAWSPDGKRIAVSACGGIKLITPSGTDVTPVNGRPACPAIGVAGEPIWSPDGRKIAIKAKDGIYTMNANGAYLTKVTSDPGGGIFGTGKPSWQPR